MHQYLFFIGNWPIRFYGIFFSLGIISGCIMAYFLLKKENKEIIMNEIKRKDGEFYDKWCKS